MIRNQFPLNTVHRDLHVVAGSFATNGASAISAASREGVGYSVSRTGVGTIRIQLGSPPTVPAGLLPATDRNLTVVSGVATPQDSAAGDHTVVIKAMTASTGVIDLETRTAGAVADLPATARVNFVLFLTDSVVTPVRG